MSSEEVLSGNSINQLNELGDEIESIISDKAPEILLPEETDDAPNLYRGEALNKSELYELTARRRINLIYVAGSVRSGKTTLLTMMQHMFVAGKNERLEFAGSLTLMGYKKRTAGLLIANGNSVPQMGRTSSLDTDIFLHLILSDVKKEKQELVFSDISGELAGPVESHGEEIYNVFYGVRDLQNVIIVIDGEGLSGKKRFAVQNEGYSTFTRLYEQQVIGRDTAVHMVISKYDKIMQADNCTDIQHNINNYKNEFIAKMQDKCRRIDFYETAAISQCQQINNYHGIEKLLVSCMEHEAKENVVVNETFMVCVDRHLAKRSFDKFAWKG